MDSQAIYNAICVARDTKQARKVWVKRAPECGCWLAACYSIRGKEATIARNEYRGQHKAWMGEKPPATFDAGCVHRSATVELS